MNDTTTLENLFLICPITQEKLHIREIKLNHSSKEHFELIVKGKTTSWKYKISMEEV